MHSFTEDKLNNQRIGMKYITNSHSSLDLRANKMQSKHKTLTKSKSIPHNNVNIFVDSISKLSENVTLLIFCSKFLFQTENYLYF